MFLSILLKFSCEDDFKWLFAEKFKRWKMENILRRKHLTVYF